MASEGRFDNYEFWITILPNPNDDEDLAKEWEIVGEWVGEVEVWTPPEPEKKKVTVAGRTPPVEGGAPSPWIVDLEEQGKLTIAFDKRMKIPEDLTKLRS